MTYNELMSSEKTYYEKLTEDERKIYRANFEQLAVLATSTDRTVLEFVDIARAYEELNRLHARYNDIQEKVYLMPNATETQQELYNSVYEASEELFSYTLSIGRFSAVINLSNMDECDALYRYLSALKMFRFDYMLDEVDIDTLIYILVSHNVYN